MTRRQILDLYFIEARSRLLDVAAFLDRVERASGEDDYRIEAFRKALEALCSAEPNKAARALLTFSDPTTEPIPAAPMKGATGAYEGGTPTKP